MIEVVEARAVHIGPLASASDDCPRALLRIAFRESSYKRVALLNGRVAAAWGVVGPLLTSSGHVWLVLSREARSAGAIAIMGIVRQELTEISALKNELTTCVAEQDARAVRFLQFLGFTIGAPDDAGSCSAVLRRHARPLMMAA